MAALPVRRARLEAIGGCHGPSATSRRTPRPASAAPTGGRRTIAARIARAAIAVAARAAIPEEGANAAEERGLASATAAACAAAAAASAAHGGGVSPSPVVCRQAPTRGRHRDDGAVRLSATAGPTMPGLLSRRGL